MTTYASRGTFVTPLDGDRIREAQFLREALELAIVGKLADKAQLDRLRALPLRDAAHVGRLLREHETILSAIVDGRPCRVISVTQRHLRSVLDVLEDVAARHAHCFDGGLWRRAVSIHLDEQRARGLMDTDDARELAVALSRDLALDTYRLRDDAPECLREA